MKIAALTMVYQDYWALDQWYRHYSHLLGAENLYIVVHGPDDSIRGRCPRANIIHVPRDDLSKFDKRRSALLNGIAAGLRQMFRWVIRTDVDELIAFDPALYDSLSDALHRGANGAPALFALGMNLIEMPDDSPFDDNLPLAAQRRCVSFSGHYSKAFATSGTVDLWRHGVKVLKGPFREFPFELPEGLYLVHLKHTNLTAAQKADAVRQEIATPGALGADGLPGESWAAAFDDTRKLLDRHYARRQASWRVCETEAYVEISENPRRFRKIGLIKTRSFRFDTRTDMPDWLADQLAPLPE